MADIEQDFYEHLTEMESDFLNCFDCYGCGKNLSQTGCDNPHFADKRCTPELRVEMVTSLMKRGLKIHEKEQ